MFNQSVYLLLCIEPSGQFANLYPAVGVTTERLWHQEFSSFLSLSGLKTGSGPMFIQKPTVVQKDGKIFIEVVCQATGDLKLDWFRGDDSISSDNKYNINTVVAGDKHTSNLVIQVSWI